MKPIDIMHESFGVAAETCKTCSHLIRHRANRVWFKCEVWGESSCEKSDWRLKYQACGMYNKQYIGRPLKDIVKHHPRTKVVEQVEGQLRLWE